MTQKPPVPEASQSPYPVAEPPHFASSARYESDAEADGDADGGGFSLSRLFEDFRVRDLSLDDLGIDSLDFLDIAFAIDKAFGIKMPFEQWTQEVNEGKASAEQYFVLQNLCERVDELIAAKTA